MKKRILSLALTLCLCLALMPAASAAEPEPIGRVPDVFQGDGLYITATPWEIKNNTDGWQLIEESSWQGGGPFFSDGYATVLRSEREVDDYGYYTGFLIYFMNLVDTEGNLMWEEPVRWCNLPGTTDVFIFSEGLVGYYDPETGLLGYRNAGGQVVIPAQFEYAEPFHDGLAEVSPPDDDNIYFIDQTGAVVLGPLNGEAGHFSNGLLNYVGYLGEGRPYFAGYLDRQGRPAITIYPGGAVTPRTNT